MKNKLARIADLLNVSTTDAQVFIGKVHRDLHRRPPFQVIYTAIQQLPKPLRNPQMVALHIKYREDGKPVEALLAEEKAPAPKTEIHNYKTRVVGVTFNNRQEVVNRLKEGEQVRLNREPTNPFDANAILVCTEQNEEIGYIDRYLAAMIAPKVDLLEENVTGEVIRVFPNGFPAGTSGVNIKFDLEVVMTDL